MKISIEWKLQDFWVGAFWKITPLRLVCYCGDYCDTHNHFSGHGAVPMDQPSKQVDIWICAIPCLPIHISYDA